MRRVFPCTFFINGNFSLYVTPTLVKGLVDNEEVDCRRTELQQSQIPLLFLYSQRSYPRKHLIDKSCLLLNSVSCGSIRPSSSSLSSNLLITISMYILGS